MVLSFNHHAAGQVISDISQLEVHGADSVPVELTDDPDSVRHEGVLCIDHRAVGQRSIDDVSLVELKVKTVTSRVQSRASRAAERVRPLQLQSILFLFYFIKMFPRPKCLFAALMNGHREKCPSVPSSCAQQPVGTCKSMWNSTLAYNWLDQYLKQWEYLRRRW